MHKFIKTKITKESLAVLFIQSAPSQLDSPFYSQLSALTGQRIALALLNDGTTQRRSLDPELGVIPQFEDLSVGHPLFHLPSELRGGMAALISLIRRVRPRIVVIQDQSWKLKVAVSGLCKILGIYVVMRSDKNSLSGTARRGISRQLEILFVNFLFDGIAPISKLTLTYYRWRKNAPVWWFPYPSSKAKFSIGENYVTVRRNIRTFFGISDAASVFLAVVKFVERENPAGIIRAFAELRSNRQNVCLLMVGSGPLDAELKQLVQDLGVEDVYFCGYVPYPHLQDYFWSADVFVHLAWIEPWGVSPQDALVAHLGVVTSDRVGSGICHLDDDLSKYVVSPEDYLAASKAMQGAISSESSLQFSRAWGSVDKYFTAEGLSAWWAERLQQEGWLKSL